MNGNIDPYSMYKKYTNRGFVINTKGFAGAIEMFKNKVNLNLQQIKDFYPNQEGVEQSYSIFINTELQKLEMGKCSSSTESMSFALSDVNQNRRSTI
jgi:hypothetical protein